MSAGGIFIAIGLLLGAGIGIYLGQPSAGVLIGAGVGILLAILTAVFSGAGGPPRSRGR